ncbi:MAG: guanylate kinase [Pseudomonadota bacterium]
MQNKIYTKRRGLMFVLSSPSGAGKTTISRRMLELDKEINLSVSVTTRQRRSNEMDGRDYHFISNERYAQMIIGNELLEHATVFDYHYGTPAKQVHQFLEKGEDVLFDIDWQGTRQLAQTSRDDLVSVFILPPSMEELERRLKSRAMDSDEVVAKRMAKAQSEISHWQEYDYVIVNDDLEATIKRVIAILQSERLRRTRQIGIKPFVDELI